MKKLLTIFSIVSVCTISGSAVVACEPATNSNTSAGIANAFASSDGKTIQLDLKNNAKLDYNQLKINYLNNTLTEGVNYTIDDVTNTVNLINQTMSKNTDRYQLVYKDQEPLIVETTAIDVNQPLSSADIGAKTNIISVKFKDTTTKLDVTKVKVIRSDGAILTADNDFTASENNSINFKYNLSKAYEYKISYDNNQAISINNNDLIDPSFNSASMLDTSSILLNNEHLLSTDKNDWIINVNDQPITNDQYEFSQNPNDTKITLTTPITNNDILGLQYKDEGFIFANNELITDNVIRSASLIDDNQLNKISLDIFNNKKIETANITIKVNGDMIVPTLWTLQDNFLTLKTKSGFNPKDNITIEYQGQTKPIIVNTTDIDSNNAIKTMRATSRDEITISTFNGLPFTENSDNVTISINNSRLYNNEFIINKIDLNTYKINLLTNDLDYTATTCRISFHYYCYTVDLTPLNNKVMPIKNAFVVENGNGKIVQFTIYNNFTYNNTILTLSDLPSLFENQTLFILKNGLFPIYSSDSTYQVKDNGFIYFINSIQKNEQLQIATYNNIDDVPVLETVDINTNNGI